MTHVLAVRLDNDGDVLLAGPALRALAAGADRLTLLCGPRGRQAAELLEGIDEIVCWRAPWIDPEPDALDAADVLALAGRLAELGIDRALIFGSGLSAVGFGELWLGVNLLTALLALFTLASYLFVYTPLKRVSPVSTTIGAIPGAMPPLIGYAAATGHLNYEAGILFAILFLWQFPHFYAIAWMYREDYARAGIRMLPVVEPTVDSTARRIVWFSMALVPMSLAPKFMNMAGNFYLFGASVLGTIVLYAGFQANSNQTRLQARRVLLASVLYLPLLYGLMALDS